MLSTHFTNLLFSPSLHTQHSHHINMPAKIAVIVWSLYGHVAKLSEEVIAGLKAKGADVEVFQVS